MNSVLMEELLNEEESSTLDFKRDQYLFEKATDDEKSELLKDILAFSNAWRRTDAYILIGIEEAKGRRSKVIGTPSHFDDASLQQFVNSKTNRPVTFSYKVFAFENTQIGVVHIPLQERPIFIKKDFGKLKQHNIYIRRNSSTDIADPDEVAKMGSLKIQEILGDIVPQTVVNPVVLELRREQEQDNIVLVEVIRHKFDSFRLQCKVIDVTDLYAVFREASHGQEVSGSISQITVAYQPSMKMKLFSISPLA